MTRKLSFSNGNFRINIISSQNILLVKSIKIIGQLIQQLNTFGDYNYILGVSDKKIMKLYFE